MWHSLRLRLLLASIVVVLIAVGVTAFVASRRTAGEFRRYVERREPIDGRRLAFLIARAYSVNESWEGIQGEVEQISAVSGDRVVVVDAAGIAVADSKDEIVGKPVDARWPPPVATLLSGEGPVGALYVLPNRGPNDPDRAFVSAVNRSVLLGALVAGLVAVLLALATSSRILKPVERLTEAARRMEKGDLSVQVDIDSEDEIGQLAHAFNSMAGSLAQQEALRRNMVSDVAHELRTPLTNLRGYLEASRDGLLPPDAALVDNLYEETMLLQRLVTDLQDLALADAGQLTLVRTPTDLANLVERAATMMQPQAHEKGLTVAAEAPDDLPLVDADPERVGQILRNLLNNAVAHTPPGGAVTLTAESRDGEVAVTVRDTGAGIPAEHLPHVFDRFYRVDKSRTRQTGGAGLGLAIVRQLVVAHGGSVSAESTPGQGSAFTFTLPVDTGSRRDAPDAS
jgi:signal transduction histidine kinase